MGTWECRKSSRKKCRPAIAYSILLLLALPCHGQEARSSSRIGMPYDWTHRHVVFSNPRSLKAARAVFAEPRYWNQRMRRDPWREPPARLSPNTTKSFVQSAPAPT